ncbi:uncharacterized protein [Henckelia pumila]|uniref:uncharacterized protein n=1 Tax=Henckelia pumila TaxID=405737 RepID=UPI003C6E7016
MIARIARGLESALAEQLKACLAQNMDVFSWSTKELAGIPVHLAEHKLNILPRSRPIKQKKRHFGTEKDKVIADQVRELLEAGHVKEVQFSTWLSNVVLVPKSTGKWRMCIDFRDLNKACPKDCYLLPRIDQLVDFTSGFELLWSHISKDDGKSFPKPIGQECRGIRGRYFGKSQTRDNFIFDLEETFGTLRRYGVKLNPAKCVFGVEWDVFGICSNRERNRGEAGESKDLKRDFITLIRQGDEANSLEGSGVGVVLISPTEEKTKVAVRLPHSKSNNEAEYEAVITCLKLAREAGAGHVIVYYDSQLVVQQVQGTFGIRERILQEYARLVRQQGEEFSSWSIEQIPREHNSEADTLAKMAASLTSIDIREVIQQSGLVMAIGEEAEEAWEGSWMTPLIGFLQTGILPEEEEVHEGCCGDHGGDLSLSRHTFLAGYWWPTLQQDARETVRTCEGCQRFGNFSHKPAAEFQVVWASCPFDHWGLDIVGPFSMGPEQKNFLLVAVDYFSKWVEAESLAKITEGAVLGFIRKNIVCRFGYPGSSSQKMEGSFRGGE